MIRKALTNVLVLLTLSSLCFAEAYYIDRDGDGYGVASPLGPDSNDYSALINTTSSTLNHYGSVGTYLDSRGYQHNNLYVVSPGDNINQVMYGLKPGDTMLFRGGTYTQAGFDISGDITGTQSHPITFAAYPGERPLISATHTGIGVGATSQWLNFDGFALETPGGQGDGIKTMQSQHLTFRNIDQSGAWLGWRGMYKLNDITVENSIFRNNGSHGVYWGATAVDPPNTNLTIRDSISYGNGKHGFQHNGPVNNLTVENNQFHSNDYAGISLLEGVSNSTVRGNLIYNNGRQGIVFYLYDDDAPDLHAVAQNNNLVEGNTIWIGKYYGEGTEPNDHPAIEFWDDTLAQSAPMTGNVIRDNILVTQNGPTLLFGDQRFFPTTTVEGNTVYRASGEGAMVTIDGQTYTINQIVAMGGLFSDNTFKLPQFKDVSVNYYTNADLFDFTVVPEPATLALLGAGLAILVGRKRRRGRD